MVVVSVINTDFIPQLHKKAMLLGFINISSCDCMQSRDPDPVVDISYMYRERVNKNYIGEGYFVTCRSHKQLIEQQIVKYGDLTSNDSFWSFVSNPKRVATAQPHHQIEEFIKLGIPPKFRSNVWQALCGCTTTTQELKKYKELLDAPRQEDYASQIALDVNRTFEAISDPNFIEKLTRVLIAYANHNPTLGYCQSMNVLAGTLLLFMEEQEAFWVLVYLVETMLKNYHSLTMSGFHADAELFKWLVADNLPELHKHFQSVQFDLLGLVAPWFLSLYIHEMPFITACFVWDHIMLEGTYAMFEVGLALLRMHQDEVLQIHNDIDIVVLIKKRTSKMFNPKKLLEHWKKLDTDKVDSAKQIIQKRIEEEAARVADLHSRFAEISIGTHFEVQDIKNLWHQKTLLVLGVSANVTGFDFKRFSQFIGGTFSEWRADIEIVRRLHDIADVDKNGYVDFGELVNLLSLICRGTFTEVIQFNFRLFDVGEKGWMDKFDLARMLQSLYSLFVQDKRFDKLLQNFVNKIFENQIVAYNKAITEATFYLVVQALPKLLQTFKERNPKLKYNPKNTYFFWMNTEEKRRNTELIQIAFDQQAHIKQASVRLPTIFADQFHFSIY